VVLYREAFHFVNAGLNAVGLWTRRVLCSNGIYRDKTFLLDSDCSDLSLFTIRSWYLA
jgi:hypothetical protein